MGHSESYKIESLGKYDKSYKLNWIYPRSVTNSRSSMCSNEMALEAVELLSNASHTDLAFEWSMLCQDCAECWTTTGKKVWSNVTF